MSSAVVLLFLVLLPVREEAVPGAAQCYGLHTILDTYTTYKSPFVVTVRRLFSLPVAQQF